jgi:hypothetical protein
MRANRTTLALLFGLLYFGTVQLSRSGSGYEVTCKDSQCGFVTQAGFGGGFEFEQTSGYCMACDKWATITWPRRSKAPEPIAVFWDPLTGMLRMVHKCPTCTQPFVVVNDAEDLKFCPKCKKPSLKSKQTVFYD